MSVEMLQDRAVRTCCNEAGVCSVSSICFAYFKRFLTTKCGYGRTDASFNQYLDRICEIRQNHGSGTFYAACPYEKLQRCY